MNVPVKELFADDGKTGFIKVKGDVRGINSIKDIKKLLEEIDNIQE